MKKIYNPPKESWTSILQRPIQSKESLEETVLKVFRDVELNGDKAIAKYTSIFDGVTIKNPHVEQEELEGASTLIPQPLKNAIEIAKQNITLFHKAQLISKIEVETTQGVLCWQEQRPITSIGIYI